MSEALALFYGAYESYITRTCSRCKLTIYDLSLARLSSIRLEYTFTIVFVIGRIIISTQTFQSCRSEIWIKVLNIKKAVLDLNIDDIILS